MGSGWAQRIYLSEYSEMSVKLVLRRLLINDIRGGIAWIPPWCPSGWPSLIDIDIASRPSRSPVLVGTYPIVHDEEALTDRDNSESASDDEHGLNSMEHISW